MKFSLAIFSLLASAARAQPTNDLCSAARPIELGETYEGSTLGATSDLGFLTSAGLTGSDEELVCVDEGFDFFMASGVWYKFDAPSCGKVEIDQGFVGVNICDGAGDSNYDSAMSIYSGSCESLACEAGGVDLGTPCDGSIFGTKFSFNVESGTTYYVLVHGLGSNTGTFTLDFKAVGVYGQCGGDPHFQTWAGDWYDFHGEGDLVFVSQPAFGLGLGLDINLRTTGRYEYSYIESAAVRIGDDILQVSGYGGYMVNGISNAELPMKLSDQYLLTRTQKSEKESIFEIVLSEATAETIVIRSFKDLVGIKFSNPSPDTFGSSVGLMGSFANGDRLSRNGTTIMEDANEFGQEWQVLDTERNLFQTARAPQYPEKIKMPDAAASETRKRRLGEAAIDEEAAELACAHHLSKEGLAMCVYDVMATGDLELAHGGVF